MLNFDDPRSKLFFEFEAILKHIQRVNPDVKFLLENVAMRIDFVSVISTRLGVYPVQINANRVGPASRNRLYWTNFKTKYDPVLGIDVVDIPQPAYKPVPFRDIMQEKVPSNFYLSEKALLRLDRKYKKGSRSTNPRIVRYGSDSQIRAITASSYKRGFQDSVIETKDGRLRYVTPDESLLVQGIHSPYVWAPGISSTDRLIMAGNGWSVDVIKHILKYYA